MLEKSNILKQKQGKELMRQKSKQDKQSCYGKFQIKMSRLWFQSIKRVSKPNYYTIKCLFALLWPIPFNNWAFVSFIFMILEKISPFICFKQKCPDFLLKMSGILDPRVPPFRRSESVTASVFRCVADAEHHFSVARA